MAQVPNEKFYTKSNIAKICIKQVTNLEEFDKIIEPSAGSGAFSSQIEKCIAYDIEPENDDIIKLDFFELHEVEGDKILFIGNPPFGSRSALAKKFIKHSIKLNAHTIAFILPNTFSKVSNQKFSLFPEEWKLISVTDLGSDAFEIYSETYHVPCSFYIWTRGKSYVNFRKTKLAQPSEFKFLRRNSKDADFVLNGNSAKVRNLSEVTNPKAEHYIKVSDKNRVTQMRALFGKLPYKFDSSCNGGNAWISQQEIIAAFNEYKSITSSNV